jgi:hypothetical protein
VGCTKHQSRREHEFAIDRLAEPTPTNRLGPAARKMSFGVKDTATRAPNGRDLIAPEVPVSDFSQLL